MLPPTFQCKLYAVPLSAAGRAVWLYMQECEVMHVMEKLVPEDIYNKIEEISPKRSIGVVLPVLHDSGVYLYGCISILKYLADKCQRFYPADRVERAKVDMYLEWHSQHLHNASANVLELTTPSGPGLFRNYIKEAAVSADGMVQQTEKRTTDIELVGAAVREYMSMINVMEKVMLANTDFLCGAQITIADIVAVTELSFHQIIDIDLKEYPKVHAWFLRVSSTFKNWDVVNAEFVQYIPSAVKQQQALRQEQKNIKRHGKDARGGARPPDVRHRVLFHRPIHEVYQMLLDEQQMSELTGKPCTISAKPGGKFSFYDGQFSGTSLYLMENLKLLQSWSLADWPPNTQSTVKIQLVKVSETKTELSLEQSDVPKNYLKKIDETWLNMFWIPTGGVLLRDIAYTLFFEHGTPHMVYELLLDSTRVSKYMGKKCELSRGVGAQFSYLDGTVQGTILELVTDAKIVQDWRGSDWPELHHSKLTIILRRVPLGTELAFSQVNVPVEKYRTVNEIWDKYFWKNIRREIKHNYESLSAN